MVLKDKKALWVSDDLHSEIKSEAALIGKPIHEFVKVMLVFYRTKGDGY